MLSSACCLVHVARSPQALVERGVSRQLQWLTKAALLVLFHAASTPDHRLALCALLGVPFLTELVVALPSGEPATADAPAEAGVALFGIAALNVSGPSRHVLLMLVGRLMTESKNCKLFVKEEAKKTAGAAAVASSWSERRLLLELLVLRAPLRRSKSCCVAACCAVVRPGGDS